MTALIRFLVSAVVVGIFLGFVDAAKDKAAAKKPADPNDNRGIHDVSGDQRYRVIDHRSKSIFSGIYGLNAMIQ